MSKEQKSHEKQAAPQGQQQGQEQGQQQAQPQNRQQANDVDGLADKKPEELTPEELRLMADTMPGEGPGD
ncbi:hypothetical protein [Massilia sp. BHUDP2]|uniref:hypothetical protein n=1 Tax=Massilia sp. BHUDP2 TaxID=3034505 RepID=UPI001AE21B47